MTERIKSYTAHCKRAAQELFWLLREIDAVLSAADVADGKAWLAANYGNDEEAAMRLHEVEAATAKLRALAAQRHLWCVEPDPTVEAVEPIVPGMHRQWLREPHPQALPEGSKLRSDPGQLVTE